MGLDADLIENEGLCASLLFGGDVGAVVGVGEGDVPAQTDALAIRTILGQFLIAA